MRTVPFNIVYESILRRHGLDPLGDAVTQDTARAVVQHINKRLKIAWQAWDWPELRVTEERAYRTIWSADKQFLRVGLNGKPDELFYIPTLTYYKVLVTAVTDPPIGTLPTDTAYFEVLTQIDPYISFDQICRRPIGIVFGVYAGNPRLNGCGKGLRYRPSEYGIDILGHHGPTAFIQYQLPPVRFSAVPYAPGKEYPARSTVYHTGRGECYFSLVDSVNVEPPNPTVWVKVPLPEFFEDYIIAGAFADGLRETGNDPNAADVQVRQAAAAIADQEAQQYLESEIDIRRTMHQRDAYNFRKTICAPRFGICVSEPWVGGETTTLTDICESGYPYGGEIQPAPPPAGLLVPPHYVYAGPATGITPDFPTFRLEVPDDITFAAILEKPNVFTRENTFNGLRLVPKTVDTDYVLKVTDFEVGVDASAGPLQVFLPRSLATGQMFRVKKVDATDNPVFIRPVAGDTIDGASSLAIVGKYGIILIDALFGDWDNASSVTTFVLPPNVALRDQENVFTQLNTFNGIRIIPKLVTEDYTLTPQDFAVYVDASAGPVNISLPQSFGNGQMYRIKKIDATGNIVAILAFTGDNIDGSVSINFVDQYADAQLIDALLNYWDNTGSAAGGGAGVEAFTELTDTPSSYAGEALKNVRVKADETGLEFTTSLVAGVNFRIRDLDPIHGVAFDVLDIDDTTWVEQVRFTLPSTSPPPTAVVSYFWRPEINDTTGLAAWPTVGLLVNSRLDALFTGKGLTVWILVAGPADGADPGQVAPDDYDPLNPVHWAQAL